MHAGILTLMMVIPLQGKLAGRIAGLRTRTAARTDERVRITGAILSISPTCSRFSIVLLCASCTVYPVPIVLERVSFVLHMLLWSGRSTQQCACV